MGDTMRYANIVADGATSYQTIDGFGVNINSKYWDAPGFSKVMDLLIEDLGATLYRVDIWGKSNWVDPASERDAGVLNQSTYERVYGGETFRKGWAMMRHLNEHGVQPYLTASGDVPTWMLGDDGKPSAGPDLAAVGVDDVPEGVLSDDRRLLVQYDQFVEMLVSMVEWAKMREKLDFVHFGPLNETDIGSPEGPSVSPEEYVKVVELLHRKLDERGLDDIRLVVAEQAMFNTDYVIELVESEILEERIGAFGLHTYFDYPLETYTEVVDAIQNSPHAGASIWLSEYGDLDQTGEKEWLISWMSTRRLLDVLEAGFTGAMAWDAFDNYHDHNEFWTIYGLIRTGLRAFTPKKRYYAAKQVYRYVRPGFQRIDVQAGVPGLRLLGFANPERTEVTLVGMNASTSECYLNISLQGFDSGLLSGQVGYYRTSETEDCFKVGENDVTSINYPYAGIDVCIPPRCIFTLTSVE